MGRARSRHRPPPPRSTVPLHRRITLDPAALRSWLLIGAAAVVVAALVGHVVSQAEAARRRWGETRPVLVADRAIAVGGHLRGATSWHRWPVAVLPKGALRALPQGARAGVAMSPGSVLTRASVRRVVGDRGGGGDRRRLAVPLGAARPQLRIGDRVDVWATTDPSLSNGHLSTNRVADTAVVTSIDDRSATVAVKPAEVPAVAEATSVATITLVVLP